MVRGSQSHVVFSTLGDVIFLVLWNASGPVDIIEVKRVMVRLTNAVGRRTTEQLADRK